MRALISLFLSLPSLSLVLGQPVPAKKLIEFGWDEPNTAFLRKHIKEMERTPFDGCVFSVQPKTARGEELNFTWGCWGKRAFTEAELAPALEDLKATESRRFTHNFLRFNVTPGNVDWFEDFSAVLNNARLAARLAKTGKCQGILFDIEAYEGQLFDFQKQKDAGAKSWADYKKQTRLRGAELMNAFQQEFPDLTILLTFGYILAWDQSNSGKKPLENCQYGLLPSLLDGMIDAARGKTRLVDGCEAAYAFKDLILFEREYKKMKDGLLPIVADPKKYHQAMSFGFGLWMDDNSQKQLWNTEDFSKNHFTPEQFEASVREAFRVSDEYVWVYTEKPRWWTENGPSTNLPPQYESAVRKAEESASPGTKRF